MKGCVGVAIFLTNEEIGNRIKQKRLNRGWTQTELGERLGVGAAAVNKWELGVVKNIKRELLQQLVLQLGIHPATLIGIDPEPTEFVVGHMEYSKEEIAEIAKFAEYVKYKRNKP